MPEDAVYSKACAGHPRDKIPSVQVPGNDATTSIGSLGGTTTAEERHRRFASVDVFRGAVLAVMILTPTTGPADSYSILRHAEWNGLTISDMVFPAFLFTSGLSLSFLLRSSVSRRVRWRMVRRVVLLMLLGLMYNAYGASWLEFSELRFTGVLQMIGISGSVAAALILVTRKISRPDNVTFLASVATSILLLYSLGLYLMSCGPANKCNPYFGVDVALMGTSHLYRLGAAGYDPEGLVTSVAASAIVLYGFCVGRVFQRYAGISWQMVVTRLATIGIAAVAIGTSIAWWLPINKRLLSPSFVLVTLGVAILMFCATYMIVDARSKIREDFSESVWVIPLVGMGRNAILVYMLERVLFQTAETVHIGTESVAEFLLSGMLWFGETHSHMLYTALTLLIIAAVTSALHQRKTYFAL